MDLREVTSAEQFADYYDSQPEDLSTCKARIDKLMAVTGISAVRHCHGASEAEVLKGLEHSVLHGSWREFDDAVV